MAFTSKWGDPEILGETDLRGNMTPASMIALQRAAVEADQRRKDDDLQYQRDMARNRRIAFWNDRGTSSWEEPDYEGANLEQRQRNAADIQLDTQQKSGDIAGHLAETYEPGAYARRAVGAAQSADAVAKAAADRYWDPMTHSMNDELYNRKFELGTTPAEIAAKSRGYVADTAAGAKLGEANIEAPSDAIAALAKLIGAGGYGTNPKTGDKTPAPPAVQNQIASMLQRVLSGGGDQTTFDPAMEKEIAGAMQATGSSRQEVIDHFKKIGRIR